MHKILFMACALFATQAQAMPLGSFDCKSTDGTIDLSIEIGMYSKQLNRNTVLYFVNGSQIPATISRQWVDLMEANVQLTLPVGSEDFAVYAVLKTEMEPVNASRYEGTIWTETWKDYAGPVERSQPKEISCEISG